MRRSDSASGKRSPPTLWANPEDRFFLINLVVCLGIAVLALLLFGPGAAAMDSNFDGLAPGQIVDRDITAGKDVVYVDAEATSLRLEAEERLILPVYQMDTATSARIIESYRAFAVEFREIMSRDMATETAVLMVMSKFPDALPKETLLALAQNSLKSQALVYAEDILGTIMMEGVFAIPSEGMDRFNQDYLELRRKADERSENEQRATSIIVTLARLDGKIESELQKKHLVRSLAQVVKGLVSGFVRENVFFDEALTRQKLERVQTRVGYVTRAVGKNEILARKGDILTEENYARIQAIRQALSRTDMGMFLRGVGILLAAAVLGLRVLKPRSPGLSPINSRGGTILSLYGTLLFYGIALFATRLAFNDQGLKGLYFIPIALFPGLASALVSSSFGALYSVVLGLLVASASNFNAPYLIFVILSGTMAGLMASAAKTRLVLVRASALQALGQAIIGLVLLIQQSQRPEQLFTEAALLGLNGFISGALVLALLPVLEQSLNLPTRFRLLELSDVNAPPLKQLLTEAPGTYAHSMNVAHLAEAAAEDVGANALLARVGAYYHDIGKIAQPEYFVENQRGTNKHDELNPRLSATVIRSHVKQGIETAKDLKLPQAVVDIVAQHHGNSIIAWFYDKARKEDEASRKEDFTYPGNPPASKEAGIVMLADAVEASTRTLKNPTVPRLDTHVRELILSKVQEGQLDDCMLTLKDLETIRHAFVRIMAGQFHSRIEYPKQKEDRS